MVMESDDMAAVKTLHLHGVDVNTIYTITRTVRYVVWVLSLVK